MTREEKLYSMRMQDLELVADKLGIKINKKGSKSKAIEKILEAEGKTNEPKPEVKEEKKVESKPVEKVESAEKPEPKRGALLEYKGKSQNICAWAKELGKSANTLYGRIYKLGWSVEDAFEK